MNSMNTRRGLGRGLGALIPPAPPQSNGAGPGRAEAADWIAAADPTSPPDAAVGGAFFAEIPTAAIRPNPRQPRQVFDEESLTELAQSIAEVGLLQPVVVRQHGEDYELVMGERRWRACQRAGRARIPAIVRATGDEELLRDALLENIHRAQLNPLEEAAAYQQLLDDFGCTHEELATRVGKSRPQISNTLRLLRLSVPVQRRLAAGVLSAGHARALVGLEEPAAQERWAARVAAEQMSVRALEEALAATADPPGGEPAGAVRSAGQPRVVSPRLVELAARLSDRFDTRVSVTLGRRKGRVVVEFASLDDLERIASLLDRPSNNPT